MISIHIIGLSGARGVAEFKPSKWRKLSPAGKVLAIHDQRRDVTRGERFQIIRTDGF